MNEEEGCLLKETKTLIRRYNLRPKRRLGQNFLISDKVLNAIIDTLRPSQGDTILEIGSGLGSLTGRIARDADYVFAIEIDDKLVDILRDRFRGVKNIIIFHGDILKIDLNDLLSSRSQVKVVGNLPYYITTPIINHLLDQRIRWTKILLMLQREVAERVLSHPGKKTYGALTIRVGYFGSPKLLSWVPRRCFLPSPDVDSGLISIHPRKETFNARDESSFFPFVQRIFSQRRKTIKRILSNLGYTIGKDDLLAVGIDPDQRPEGIAIGHFVGLFNLLFERGMV